VTVIYERTQQGAASPAVAPMSSADVEARLRRLEDLRSVGAITTEEYEAKRAGVLAEL
jgi:hypothetical protein